MGTAWNALLEGLGLHEVTCEREPEHGNQAHQRGCPGGVAEIDMGEDARVNETGASCAGADGLGFRLGLGIDRDRRDANLYRGCG